MIPVSDDIIYPKNSITKVITAETTWLSVREEMNMPMALLRESDVFEKIIAIKYDVPNKNLEMFDTYHRMIDDFYAAIHAAADAAQPGDVVLLSPAAAAFDKFKNFMVRGREFKKTVMAL